MATPGRRYPTLPTAFVAFAAILLLLAAYKLLPGQLPNAQSMIGDAAYATCLHDTRLAGGEGCLNFGYPHGSPKPFGLPVNLVADAVFGGDGEIDPGEVRSVYAGFLVLAFVLAGILFRMTAGSWWLGLLGAMLYLLAPVVQQQSGYAALQLGLALIPGYLLLDVLLLAALRQRRHGLAALLLAGVAAVRVFALFLDGYSFLFGCALSAVYFAVSAMAGRGERWQAVVALLIHVACTAFAAWVYRQYMPSNALGVMPLDFFRGAGVDVLTMFVPLQWQGLYGLAGIGLDIQPEMSYGGRASLLGTFIGYSYLIAVAILAWGVVKRRIAPGVLAGAVMLAGLVAVVVSLGPSLKFNDFRDSQTRGSALAFNAYLMPESAATMPLHTGWIYQNAPGISNARVLARWQVLARLALVVVMLLVLRELLRKGHRVPAVLLAVLAMLEVAPNPVLVAEESRGARARAELVYGDYAEEFAAHVKPGERVLLLQLHDGASSNEYAANTLCARARARCYNAGGDKASIVVEAAWPEEVRAVKQGKDAARNVVEAFRNDVVDIVVVPHFDLRHVVYPWWTESFDMGPVEARIRALDAAGLEVVRGDGFHFLRGTGPAGPVSARPRRRDAADSPTDR
ncbi:hypothetical protein [Luteimonas sp. A501]